MAFNFYSNKNVRLHRLSQIVGIHLKSVILETK